MLCTESWTFMQIITLCYSNALKSKTDISIWNKATVSFSVGVVQPQNFLWKKCYFFHEMLFSPLAVIVLIHMKKCAGPAALGISPNNYTMALKIDELLLYHHRICTIIYVHNSEQTKLGVVKPCNVGWTAVSYIPDVKPIPLSFTFITRKQQPNASFYSNKPCEMLEKLTVFVLPCMTSCVWRTV